MGTRTEFILRANLSNVDYPHADEASVRAMGLAYGLPDYSIIKVERATAVQHTDDGDVEVVTGAPVETLLERIIAPQSEGDRQ